MQTGFDNINVKSIWRGEDIPDLLPDGFTFWWRGHQYRHRPGGFSDGLSSPQFLHIGADTDSRDWAYPAAVAHDGGYHDSLDVWRPERVIEDANENSQTIPGFWEPFTLAKDECDQMFKELMDSIAVNDRQRMEAIAFYEAVRIFGQAAFNAGRRSA